MATVNFGNNPFNKPFIDGYNSMKRTTFGAIDGLDSAIDKQIIFEKFNGPDKNGDKLLSGRDELYRLTSEGYNTTKIAGIDGDPRSISLKDYTTYYHNKDAYRAS